MLIKDAIGKIKRHATNWKKTFVIHITSSLSIKVQHNELLRICIVECQTVVRMNKAYILQQKNELKIKNTIE